MSNDARKHAAEEFRALHEGSTLFVMPCAWDAFSALLFERAGFSCIGTTSGGVNWTKGRMDYAYNTPRSEMMLAYGEIATVTTLPVSGDLENGYGDDPEEVAETIRASIEQGMVGGSIEDQGTVPTDADFTNGALIEFDLAVERIRAAREAANASEFPYTLTARCEVYYTGCADPYKEAVVRLNAYRAAGADCLFVPGLNDLESLEQLVKDVDGPISFGMGATPEPLTLSMLEDVGILRVSTGGGLTRATFGLVQQSVNEMMTSGTFGYLSGALSEAQINRLLNHRNSLV